MTNEIPLLEIKQTDQITFAIKCDLAEVISKKTGAPKEKVAEALADELMKFLGLNS